MSFATLIVLDKNTLRLEVNDKQKDFDVHDEISPLYFKQFLKENSVTETELTIIDDFDEDTLEIFFSNAEKLFKGMNVEDSSYIN